MSEERVLCYDHKVEPAEVPTYWLKDYCPDCLRKERDYWKIGANTNGALVKVMKADRDTACQELADNYCDDCVICAKHCGRSFKSRAEKAERELAEANEKISKAITEWQRIVAARDSALASLAKANQVMEGVNRECPSCGYDRLFSGQITRLEAENETLTASLAKAKEAWATVRARVICTVDPVCVEHGFKEAMDAVAAMDALCPSPASPVEKKPCGLCELACSFHIQFDPQVQVKDCVDCMRPCPRHLPASPSAAPKE